MRSKFNFNHLECFLLTAKHLSFSKASQELKIAQPAVSSQIKLLEEFLGVQLFLRDKSGVSLTSEGKKLYEKSAGLYEAICHEVVPVTQDGALKGTIRFGCLTEVGERIFLNKLSDFKAEHPGIQINISFLKAYEIIDKIKSNQLDLGIVPETIIQESIKCFPVIKEEIILVTNKENAHKKIAKISELPFIGYRENDPLLESFIRSQSPRANMTKLKLEMTVNSHRSMTKLLMSHPYYAVLPKRSIHSELSQKKLFQVGSKSLSTSLYLIMRDLNFPDKKLELLKSKLMMTEKDLK